MPTPVTLPPATLPGEEHAPGAPLNWLLIGPLARECAAWGEASQLMAAHLQAVQPRASLYLLDLPGTGEFWRERSPSQVNALVEQLRQRVEKSGLQGPYGLIAHSWAGALATEWARQHAGELGAVVLISPAMRPFTRVLRSVRLGLWTAAIQKVMGRWPAPAALRPRWHELRRSHPVRLRTGVAQLAAIWRYEASRRRPHTQVLLLAGKGDEWLDWRVSAAISRAWGAALRLHPQAGHDLLLDDPHWVARSMAEWLRPIGSMAVSWEATIPADLLPQTAAERP